MAAAGFTRVDLQGRQPHFELNQQGVGSLREASRGHGVTIANLSIYGGKRFSRAMRSRPARNRTRHGGCSIGRLIRAISETQAFDPGEVGPAI